MSELHLGAGIREPVPEKGEFSVEISPPKEVRLMLPRPLEHTQVESGEYKFNFYSLSPLAGSSSITVVVVIVVVVGVL